MTDTSNGRASVVILGGGYGGINAAKVLDDRSTPRRSTTEREATVESATPGIARQPRAANEILLRVLRDESSDHELAFICECGRPNCYAPVWLTRAAYEARLAASQPIVLSGHLLSAPSSA